MTLLISPWDIIYNQEEAHPRLRDWWLLRDRWGCACLTACYLLGVKVVGPRLMRHRKPFQLRVPMIAYNIGLVALNVYIFLEFFLRGWMKNYRWRCQSADFSDDEDAFAIARTCYVFYVSKYLEYIDTIFFVLRKKDDQVTKLHVFHHTVVPFSAWYLRFAPGGWNSLGPMLNSFVHVWMYLYYGLAAVGPHMQRYLWWKRHLTKLQLAHFIVTCLFLLNLALFPVEGCHVSPVCWWMTFLLSAVFLLLFVPFYFHSYRRKRPVANGKVA